MKPNKNISFACIIYSLWFILSGPLPICFGNEPANKIIQPTQVTWETDPVLSMAVSKDGKWIVYTKGDEKVSDLWLRSADPRFVVIPRKLTSDHFGKSSPVFSNNGQYIAYVGNSYDVKGDIYILDLTKEYATPVRITGRSTKDGGPCFSPDDEILYFHQTDTGDAQNSVVSILLQDVFNNEKSNALPTTEKKIIDSGIKGTFPAISPDGSQIAYVSYQTNGKGDIHVFSLKDKKDITLTPKHTVDMFPIWSPDGKFIYYTRFYIDTNKDSRITTADNPVISKIHLKTKAIYPVTPFTYGALLPGISRSHIFFISNKGGVSNCWKLPLSGVILEQNRCEEQMAIALSISQRVPWSPALTLLSYYKVLENFPSYKNSAAKAAFEIGKIYQSLEMDHEASFAFHILKTDYPDVEPEISLSEIQTEVIKTNNRLAQTDTETEKKDLIEKSLYKLSQISKNKQVDVVARSQIEAARLLSQKESTKLAKAITILNNVINNTAVKRELRAEAIILKADIYQQTGQIASIYPLYLNVISNFSDTPVWADLAVNKILTLYTSGLKTTDDKEIILYLRDISDKNHSQNPLLSIGALNRIGDIYYEKEEWQKAKQIYQKVIDDFDITTTQTAAARLSLAEILYREERFRKALELYEKEIGKREIDDTIYHLARNAYIKKSISAGEFLYRIGEIMPARKTFKELIDYDKNVVEAHRGYIKCAYVEGDTKNVFSLYRKQLDEKPEDPILLYCTGLTLTYFDNKVSLLKAKDLIEHAIKINGQIEYFHQTLGYIFEVLENVYEENTLEESLLSYKKAFFLNNKKTNPENASNLLLNIGNTSFYLKRYRIAYRFYMDKLELGTPFDNIETEIQFYYRLGKCAFQEYQNNASISAYKKALGLIDSRIHPQNISNLLAAEFDKNYRFIMDQIISPSLKTDILKKQAKSLLKKQSQINKQLFKVLQQPSTIPDKKWTEFKGHINELKNEQLLLKNDILSLLKLYKASNNNDSEISSAEVKTTLSLFAKKVDDILRFPQRFITLKTEILAGLALSHHENRSYKMAIEIFKKVYALNRNLGLDEMLSVSRRNIAHNKYLLSGTLSGEARNQMLKDSRKDFLRALEHANNYGVPSKPAKKKKALIRIDTEVAVDDVTSSKATQGFTINQEKRLINAFLSRIHIELGEIGPALEDINSQLKSFPPEKEISASDMFGVSLLYHRAALLNYAMKRYPKAFDQFAHSADLSLKMNLPVSTALNVTNAAKMAYLALKPHDPLEFKERSSRLNRLDTHASFLLSESAGTVKGDIYVSYHNLMGVYLMAYAVPDTSGISASVYRMNQLKSAIGHFSKGIDYLKSLSEIKDRNQLKNLAGLHLNMARALGQLGEEDARKESLEMAYRISEIGLFPDIKWRILCEKGQFEEALGILDTLTFLDAGCSPFEITLAFENMITRLVSKNEFEEAFNLSEIISEHERFQRTSYVLGAISEKERRVLRKAYPHMIHIRDLKSRISTVAGEEQKLLQEEIERETLLLQGKTGKNNEHLPPLIRTLISTELMEQSIILMGLAAHAEYIADAAIRKADLTIEDIQNTVDPILKETTNTPIAQSAILYHNLKKQYHQYRKQFTNNRPGDTVSDTITFFGAEPFEAIDIMECIPEDTSAWKIYRTSLPGAEYLTFIITTDDISVQHFESLNQFSTEMEKNNISYIIYENPAEIPYSNLCTYALSGTHLYRSTLSRKPFKKNIRSIPPIRSIPEDDYQIIGEDTSASQVHTLIIGNHLTKTHTVPVRDMEFPREIFTMIPETGPCKNIPDMLREMPELSLSILTETDRDNFYDVGHIFSIFGCQSVIMPLIQGKTDEFLESFLLEYPTLSALEALEMSMDEGDESTPPNPNGESKVGQWILLGHRGMTEKEAADFAKNNFAQYVKNGQRESKNRDYQKALSYFENAIAISDETRSFARYLPALLSLARENAYLCGNMEKAETYAYRLLKRIADEKPDTEEHADALLRHGLILSQMEQYEKAIPEMEESVEIVSNLELDEKYASALTNLGITLEDATHYDRALKLFISAMEINKSMGRKDMLALQHENIGRIYDLRMSRYSLALKSYRQAYHLYKGLENRDSEAKSLLDMGRCYRLLGNFVEAEKNYDDALKILKESSQNPSLYVKIIIEKANNSWFQAKYEDAFKHQRQAYTISREKNLPLMEIISLNTSGLIWWTLGDNEKALKELDKALVISQKLKTRQDEVATTLNNIGLIEREMGTYHEALKTFDKALAIDKKIKSKWAISYDLRNKGLTYLRMKEYPAAIPLFKESLKISQSIGNKINAAKAMLGLSEAYFETENYKKAETEYTKTLELSRSMSIRETEWRALYGLAQVKLKTGDAKDLQAGEQLLYETIAIIEKMRSDIKIEQLRDSFIENKLSVYETLIRLLADTGKITESLEVAERSRARNFIDLLGNQHLSLSNDIDQNLYDRQKRLRTKIEEHEALLAGAKEKSEEIVYRKMLDTLNEELKDLMLDIQVNNPGLSSLVSVNPLRASDLIGYIEEGVLLLSYYVLENELFCWVIYPKGTVEESIHLVRMSVGKTYLGHDILDYRRTIQNLEPYEEQSRRLYNTIFKPVMAEISHLDIKYLGIIPHGPLHYLSFATLLAGDQFLIDEYPMFYLPSASVLKYTLSRRKTDKNIKVLAIGNPDLGDPSLDLPFSEHEVKSIKWNFPQITIMTREYATENWVEKNIQDFGIIHIASHGEFDPVNPLFSAIKLAKDETKDGDLEASEIFGINITADLVILSACQTGLGKVTGGDDVIGLNRSFFYAGTHTIISSLWRVSDISTAILVKHFYRMYVNENKSTSLRKAILNVKQSYPHPGYWGAFNLVGDYK